MSGADLLAAIHIVNNTDGSNRPSAVLSMEELIEESVPVAITPFQRTQASQSTGERGHA